MCDQQALRNKRLCQSCHNKAMKGIMDMLNTCAKELMGKTNHDDES